MGLTNQRSLRLYLVVDEAKVDRGEKPIIEGPVDRGLGLPKEKPDKGLVPEIGATARPGVTSAAIRG